MDAIRTCPLFFLRNFFLLRPRLQLEQSLRVPHPILIKFLRRLALAVLCVDGSPLREQFAKERRRACVSIPEMEQRVAALVGEP